MWATLTALPCARTAIYLRSKYLFNLLTSCNVSFHMHSCDMPFAAWKATAVTGWALTEWCPQHHCSICPWSFSMLLYHGPFTPAFLLWKWCTCSSPNFYTSCDVNLSLSNQLSPQQITFSRSHPWETDKSALCRREILGDHKWLAGRELSSQMSKASFSMGPILLILPQICNQMQMCTDATFSLDRMIWTNSLQRGISVAWDN